MREIRLKLIKKVSFSRISRIFRDFPRDGESDACEDCRCKMPQKNGVVVGFVYASPVRSNLYVSFPALQVLCWMNITHFANKPFNVI